jgi:hypothetical protein
VVTSPFGDTRIRLIARVAIIPSGSARRTKGARQVAGGGECPLASAELMASAQVRDTIATPAAISAAAIWVSLGASPMVKKSYSPKVNSNRSAAAGLGKKSRHGVGAIFGAVIMPLITCAYIVLG